MFQGAGAINPEKDVPVHDPEMQRRLRENAKNQYGPKFDPRIQGWRKQQAGEMAQDRAGMQQAYDYAKGVGSGQIQTAAQQQQLQGMQTTAQTQQGMAASAGGGYARAAAQGAIAGNMASQSAQNAAQAGGLQAVEMQRAQAQQGQIAAQQRAMDLQAQGMSADEAMQIAQMQIEGRGLGQQAELGFGDLEMEGAKQGFGSQLGAYRRQQQRFYGHKQRADGAVGEALAITGKAMMMSDERAKNVDSDRSMVGDFLDALSDSRASYTYKDKRNEPTATPTGGKYLGIMAQRLEQVPGVGRQLVKDTPRGKMVEGMALMSALAAGVGELNERIKKVRA
jgi:hypothetical protein